MRDIRLRGTQVFLSRMSLLILLALVALSLPNALVHASKADLIYGYECQNSKCVKIELSEQNFDKAISLPVCRMLCADKLGTVWPQPTGAVHIEPLLLHIDAAHITYATPASKNARVVQLWQEIEQRFAAQLQAKAPDVKQLKAGGYALTIQINLQKQGKKQDLEELPKLTLDTDESYELQVNNTKGAAVNVNITASSFFGARHGLETLSQLIVYDDIRRELQMLGTAKILDAPKYKWRGLLLDTSRTFYSTKSIKRTLDALAMVKLNTLHWHITDSHSFPLQVKTQSELHKLGAYSPSKVYTEEDITDIVEYGRARGIRVMPEYDAPAHVGEGWQHTDMLACFRAQPWIKYCVEPPCGQLDPTVDKMYDVLSNIYEVMYNKFQPDVFHMGGDEVSVDCWNSSARIRDAMLARNWTLQRSDFMRLWGEFQKHALQRFDKISGQGENIPIVLWTSMLTEAPFIDDYLDKSRYIIQAWTTGADPKLQQILKRGYRVILSNYDALYFDCGPAGWVTDGNNWCSPYIGWQRVYDNDPQQIAGDYNSLVLGAEAAIWSEQIDEHTLDARVWPRASALAERLWSQPAGKWRQAESRMLLHRERLVENGIAAELLQPEWCLQNEQECPIDAYDKKFP